MKTNVTKSTDRSTLECDCLLMARPKNKSGNVRQVEKMKLNQVCDSITPLMSHTQMVLLSHCPLYFFFFFLPHVFSAEEVAGSTEALSCTNAGEENAILQYTHCRI